MKKKKKHLKRSHGRRNAAPTPPPRPAARRRSRFIPPLPDPPDWKTTMASALGGGGSALVSGWLANRGWDPQMVSIAMTTGGVVGALALPGPWRVAANGVAAVGAGQLALTIAKKDEEAKAKRLASAAVAAAAAIPDKPSNLALPPAVSDAFGYGAMLDDEERMVDPDLELHVG